ncbi:MAG: ferrous iron transport protein [Epulopiscium sp.]|mgnify:CR=1 FL=1|uniref:Ferrous iron transport protein A n=1 Tax=Defluviitalea raffinosedens TaxID=1450156 RepID=A0A7C8LJ78_9FIRM|nr:FeoA family protein [Defluviitalea raffinosedens]MBZ4667230.1 putative ferrous iron transport protein [Defluviitaleaceae bacterium]MDK2787679.1 ferrous iron transport protein [Candidatus Epulonipiscium sp.]KAE9636338.1 ferrous iron transport protein A [Defluviitalea raffinosedens]MBM7685359.1 ferrous iron transport protein A [Defluviitalea raffinosedens]HHW66320.1 ferrous iron transport protein A [Candidatus Epulonipiscium sp.]
MLLTMAKPGEVNYIKKITGKDQIRKFLATLGFVEGEKVTVVSENGGNMIINIKETRVALDKRLVNRIYV